MLVIFIGGEKELFLICSGKKWFTPEIPPKNSSPVLLLKNADQFFLYIFVEIKTGRMNIKFQYDCLDIDWDVVPEILKTVGMSFHATVIHRKTFLASASVVFVYDDQQLMHGLNQ